METGLMIVDDFKAKQFLYEQLSQELAPLLGRLAQTAQLSVALIEKRAKQLNSFERKIARPDKNGKYNELADVTDLCGIRVVLFTEADCQKLIAEIRRNFDIDETNSVVKGLDHEDRFGYQSTHLVVTLPKNRTDLFEWSHLSDLKAEVQIRTVLQHAWAVLDWDLRYKSDIEVPTELRRRLYRISALLETADDAFGELKRAAADLRDSYIQGIRRGNLEIPLNRDSLAAFFDSSIAQRTIQKLINSGINMHVDSQNAPFKAFDYLIRSLESCGVTTLGQLEAALQSATDEHITLFKRVADAYPVQFGLFTPIRFLVLAQMPRELRIAIIESTMDTNDKLRAAEFMALEGEQPMTVSSE